MVSADCFEYNGSNVDRSIKYEVYIDRGLNNLTIHYDIENIVIHPNFNAETKANNIAAVNFNTKGVAGWRNKIAIDFGKWLNRVYVQRVLNKPKPIEWGTPVMYVQPTVPPDPKCSEFSPIFSSNNGAFTCSDYTVEPLVKDKTDCKIPYPQLYAWMGDELYQAGIFSHAVIKGGTDLCKYDDARFYYTVLSNYIAFAQAALGKEFYYNGITEDSKPQGDPYFAMVGASARLDYNMVMLSGDFYSPKSLHIESASNLDNSEKNPNSASEKNNPDTPNVNNSEDNYTNPGITAESGSDNNEDKPSNGSSNKTTIIASVCGSIGALVLFVVFFFLVRWYRGHVSKVHDPYKERSAQEALVDMFANAGDTRPPPAYETAENTRRAENLVSVGTNRALVNDSQHSDLNYSNDKN
ncbi:hypothetical protein COEREDRAFT_10994 [Coemansia reversa NRRL 1564]|uniref:Uncharacterized protein n=1 Tax=Coemansia reversa (strain ATCC 12441 / NRRL 1564) TaxID=763665 RepID=A0A2G5B499_COERN|nr:hypothetical protein COEREDRAFT_10994 [Coemansia reversa NRRL 1564]|eukprot:PIA13826.1 hypothetical protein COEREDRAFT_10994 [Coemansia reversa NRRL 1564]